MTTNFEFHITTSPESVTRLAASLASFVTISPDLVPLIGSGGKRPSLVSDGTYGVLVNAEGYDYPRYHSPRIALHLIAQLSPRDAQRYCIRKTAWPTDFVITTPEALIDLANQG